MVRFTRLIPVIKTGVHSRGGQVRGGGGQLLVRLRRRWRRLGQALRRRRRCRAAAAAGGGGERLHRHCDLCIAFDRFVAVDWFLVDVCAGLRWIHGDGSVENRSCRPWPAAAATAPWGSASRRTTAAAWHLRRSSRRARRAPAARKSWCCCSCSAASSWCTMTGRAITTAVASQRRNQPKPPPQLKLDGDFRRFSDRCLCLQFVHERKKEQTIMGTVQSLSDSDLTVSDFQSLFGCVNIITSTSFLRCYMNENGLCFMLNCWRFRH
nr:uncharacterized protein LOC107279313 isoform X1 [Oryza sativa Japonica Group]